MTPQQKKETLWTTKIRPRKTEKKNALREEWASRDEKQKNKKWNKVQDLLFLCEVKL